MKIPSTRGGDAMQLPPITSVYTRGKAALATRAGEVVEGYYQYNIDAFINIRK